MSTTPMDCVDGNSGVVHAAYALSEYAFIFPITPSSTMSEAADAMAAADRKNCYGSTTVVQQLQSEGGAAGALHGSAAAGGLTTTFTSSQGLLLMLPNLYKLAGELIPTVVHLAARQIGTSATSIFGDQSDVAAVKQTGMAILSSHSVQEAADMAIISHISALHSSLPFVHTFDGFQTSHCIQSCHLTPVEEMAKLIPHEKVAEFRARALNPSHPHQRGVIVGRNDWMQAAEACNIYYQKTPEIVENVMKQFEKISGRRYNLFDYYGSPEAENVIVIMGAHALTVEETIDYMSEKGEKVGVLKVHLLRPWSPEHFAKALPKSCKRIAVLDRSKDAGAVGEPLFMDVVASIQAVDEVSHIKVIGGRYALADKTFTPAMVIAVFENLKKEKPIRRFCVGVNDDVMHTSLSVGSPVSVMRDVRQCLFWGMGGDGTVGGNQLAIKLIGKETPLYAQGQFFFTSHKSGGITISHLRFGPKPIKGTYPITESDFIAVHQPSYLSKYPVLESAKPGSTFLLSSQWSRADLEQKIPGNLKRIIAQKKIKFYNINALKIAQANGLGQHTNIILQTVFFKLSQVMDIDRAIELTKESVKKQYAKKGSEIIDNNIKAIDQTLVELVAVDYPSSWETAPMTNYTPLRISSLAEESDFVREMKVPFTEMAGDDIPVSKFLKNFNGGMQPNGTTRQEKRGISLAVPEWNPDKCVQCNICSASCPHAAVRPFILTAEQSSKAPQKETFTTKKLLGKNPENLQFRIQVSPLDCTGCKQCVNLCPVKCFEMKSVDEMVEKQADNFDYCISLPTLANAETAGVLARDTLKGSQFHQPLFEFNGACAGCGEAPYIKMLTQVVGDRAIFACSSGCNVAYSFSFAGNPYTVNKESGCGPATGHSLFEDTAEFLFGIAKTVQGRRKHLSNLITDLLASPSAASVPSDLAVLLKKWVDAYDNANECEVLRKQLLPILAKEKSNSLLKEIAGMSDLLQKITCWAIGGDGWSCDIDYGGVDHVLASGTNLKMLVLDTEVYSNTGGQKSKSTPMGSVHKFESGGKTTHKKDLCQIFMSYGHIYVASIALYANPAQALRAIAEAEAYDGPALIVAYSPCIEHGIEGGNWSAEAKLAVESGYWPIYRFNPTARAEGKNPFIYESPKVLSADVGTFLAKENRFVRLTREQPEKAKILHKQLSERIQERHQKFLALAQLGKAEQ